MSIYATLEELKDQIQKNGSEMDGVLGLLLEAASLAIDGYCNRPDGFLAVEVASPRYYAGSGRAHLRIDECVAISEVAVKESATGSTYTAWAAPSSPLSGDGDWIAYAGAAARPEFNRTPYTAIMVDPAGARAFFTKGTAPTVKVTARWGYALTTPAQVKEACLIQAARWFKRGESSWADSLASGEMGQLQFRKQLDPDVGFILKLGRLVRPVVGGR